MTDSCATCAWARDYQPMSAGSGQTTIAASIRCVRFPQSVTNAPTYWCGEYLKNREIASP